jgi:two-component system response regulator YesN
MPYGVMIVEDETLIRNMLVTNIDWASLNCRVVCEAGDGREAIEYLKLGKNDVDILLTDIKMDDVNGVELCQFISEHQLQINVIILTAYNLFDYAQAALRYGVKSFLLKPIDYTELNSQIRQIVSDLDLEKIKKKELIRLQEIVEKNKDVYIEKLFVRLVSNDNLNFKEIEERINYLEIKRGEYCVISFDLQESILKLGNNQSNLLAACMLISDIIKQELMQYGSCYCFFVDSMQPCFVFIPKEKKDRYELLENIQNRIYSITGSSFSVGISNWFESYTDIREAYEQALSALQYKFYFGNDSILDYQDVSTVANNIEKIHCVETDRIITNLSVGNIEESIQILSEYFEYLKARKAPHLAYIQYQMMELALSIYSKFEIKQSTLYDMTRFNEVYKNILSSLTLEELYDYLHEYITNIGEQIKNKLATGSRLVVDKIIEFLHDHYMDDICLNDLSRVVYMNPRYICKIVKKETGKTYHEILTEIRIENAKKLLGDFQFRMYKIAEMVGYSDTRLFSQAFKKVTGISATEYREMLHQKEEKSS